MTIDELKENIDTILQQSGCTAVFHFLVQTPEGPKIKLFDLDESAQNDLSGKFIQSLKDSISPQDLTLVDLTAADDRKSVIYRYDLDEIPSEMACIKTVNIHSIVEKFDPRQDALSSISATIISIGTSESNLLLYKHQYPVSLYKSDGLFALFLGGDRTRFSKFEGDIIKMNSRFEFIRVLNEMYIFDLSTLERFYGFHNAIRNVANRGIKAITDKQILESVDPISSRLDDNSFAKKVARIAAGSFVLTTIPNDVIVNFAKIHPSLQKKFSFNAAGDKFVLKTKVSQNLFIKLLNDDFLRSDLTKRYYESLAKDPI